MAPQTNARRSLSIWLPRLSTDRLRRDRPELEASRPLALVRTIAGRAVIAAIDTWADAAGAAPGMGLADARAIIPDLAHAPYEAEEDVECLQALADWAGRYSPFIALDGADALMLDITGCAHLFGGEAAMLADARDRLAAQGFTARLAIAETPGGAAALARAGRGSPVIPQGGLRDALRDLPPASLRPDADALSALARLGFKRIGELYPLPSAELARRFGRDLVLKLDRALGLAPDPLTILPPPRPNRVRLGFPDPIGLREDIEAGLARLIAHLCTRLGERGLGARRFTLTCHRADGTVEQLALGTARPNRDAAHLTRLFAERLDGIDPGFGIDLMILAAEETEELAAERQQIGFSGAGTTAKSSSAQDARLSDLWDRIAARIGPGNLVGLTALDSHLPDRSQEARPLLDDAPAKKHRFSAKGAARPSVLLGRPEHLSVLEAGDSPASPPRTLRWRGRVHRLTRNLGPERISPDWWRAAPGWADGARDYWQVEDEAGHRFWIFRQRADAPHRPDLADAGRDGWMLAGIFA